MQCEFWITNNTQCCNDAEVAQTYYHVSRSMHFAPELRCKEHVTPDTPEYLIPNYVLQTITLEECQLKRVKEAL